MTSEVEELQAIIDDLYRSIDDQDNRIVQLECDNEINSLRDALEDRQVDIITLTSERDDLEKELEQSKKEYACLAEDNEEIRDELRKLDLENDRWHDAVNYFMNGEINQLVDL